MINENSVSLCMVVYNDSARVENLVLHMRKHLVDEVVIIDQSSSYEHSEKLKEIADVYFLTRNKGNADYDRNLCYSLASKDYIIAMDGDEFLEEEEIEKLKKLHKDYSPELVWFLFNNLITHGDKEINIKDILGDDPHPRFWKREVVVAGNKIPCVLWPIEAHQFPKINTNKIVFSQVWFKHSRFLENVIRTHVSRGKNINPQAQEMEKRFIHAVLSRFDQQIIKEIKEIIPELKEYLQ